MDHVSKLDGEETYLQESSGFQVFLFPLSSAANLLSVSSNVKSFSVHGSLRRITERELRWRYEREANIYIYTMHGALITIFTDLYDRARSNVLSNAYLTVHRIGHTRDTAIACY